MEMKFFICPVCGNVMAAVKQSGVPVMCCGKAMTELVPNTSDAVFEKHVPVLTVKDQKAHVRVGAADHPMIPEHHIEWIAIQTDRGNQRKELKPGDAPAACFALCKDETVTAVYAYCNLHGLWLGGV